MIANVARDGEQEITKLYEAREQGREANHTFISTDHRGRRGSSL
jgi:hypothetical protein